MATEADTPQPVPLMETVHLTEGELDQPPESTDFLLKSAHAHESSNLQNEAAHFDSKDDLGVSRGESFLKSSMEAKVSSEDTCRKQEPLETLQMPPEAEKHLEENEKQLHVDEKFDSAETVSKEKDAAAEIIDKTENVGENIEFVDSTEMIKIEEPELEVQEVDKPEDIFDKNTEASAQTTNLTLNRTDGNVQTIKEAHLKDETENCAAGADATHTEGSVTEKSAAGSVEKQPESCSSLFNEQSYETIKLSEKESNDSAVADSLCGNNDQVAISESKEAAEDEPDMLSVSPATYSSAIEETDLIVHETEKTTSVACPTESQEPIELSENVKDTSPIADEMQEGKVENLAVKEMDIYLQKEDNSASEDTVKEIPEEIGVYELVERPGKTDRSEADKVKNEINPEQEAGERSLEVGVFEKEISGEDKNGGEDAAKESEIDLGDAASPAAAEENKVEIKDREIDLHESSVQNDELKSDKIEKSGNVAIEGTTCTEEEAVLEIKEECSEEKHGKEKSADVGVNNDDTISNKMDVPPTESTGKIEIAEAEISNAAEDEKLAKVQEVDSDEKASNHDRTNTEETVEKKEDSCDIQMPKLETSEMPDESREYNPGNLTSEEVINPAFVEEKTEQRSQPADPQETEPINEDTVNISQDTAEVAEVSGKDVDKQTTEESLKKLSQESVECLDENFQNEQITGVVTAETEKDDFNKTAGTDRDEAAEIPHDKVIEEETQNDEKKSENFNIESLVTSVNDENSKTVEEGCLTKEEILKDENSTPKEASATAELHGNDSSEIKDDQLENNAVQTDGKQKIEESMEHEENLEYTQKNILVENQQQSNIVEPSESKNHVSDEMMKDLEVETVGSDIKEDNNNAVFEAVEEDIPEKKADSAEGEVVNKDVRNNEAESETIEKDNFDQADNAEVEISEEDTEENIAKAETVKDNADAEKIEKEIAEVETVEVDKNAENAEGEIVEKDDLDKKDDESKVEVTEGSANNAEDSNEKDNERSESAKKDENIADDANQKDETPSACISTPLAEEAEKSHGECETVPPSQTSPDKKEEDVSQIQLGKDNENTAALAETCASINEEPSKEVDDGNEKSQNEDSTNTAPQTSWVEEQEILQRDNQAEAEASPVELTDEEQYCIKTDENNNNDAVELEVEEKQKEKVKDEEPISMTFEETMTGGLSKTTSELENAETCDDLGKDPEVAKEEKATPEPSEEYNQNSSREILGEFETASSGERITQEKDQKDASPCTTLPSSFEGKEERPMHEYPDATSAEVSTDERRDEDDTPAYSGENNDCNADKSEACEGTSKSEEIMEQSTENEGKLEDESPKNQPEELEQSSNAVNVETDTVHSSERAIDPRLDEIGTIQNEDVREEEEETGKIDADQVEKAAMEEVSTETNVSITSDDTGKLVPRKEETETDILSQPAETESYLTETQVEEKVKDQDASDTVEQALKESTVKDQPDEIADEKKNEDEMIISVSKEEVNEIIRTAERDDSTEKQMTEEGNAIEDTAKEPKTETNIENSEEKEIEKEGNVAELKEEVEAPKSEALITTEGSKYEEEDKNESNVAELKEEVEEPKLDATGIIEASGSEEAKGSKISETKEGSEPLPAACTDSLPEISSSNSEDRDEILEKEEPDRNDITSLSVTEAQEISLSEPVTDDKVQTESSIPTSEESELKLNSEETTPNYVNTEVSEEQMNEGENKDQETLEAVDQVKEDTDELEKATNSEGGITVKSEASSKEAIETEKSKIEQKEGDIGTKAEVDITNETMQMEERAIIFEEAIPKEENSTTKDEASSKEDAAMNGETIEPEVPISAEEHSVKEVEEASSKEAIKLDKFTPEPETAILEGALTTKPVASSKEAIEGDNKEIKPEDAISKEVEAGRITVEPGIATSEAENPIATVVMSSEKAIEVEKVENELDAAAIKEGDSATKAEAALNEDVDAEKEATQPEVAISQEVDVPAEVEESSDATITKEEVSTKNAELSVKEVEAEKFAVEPEIATSEVEYSVAQDRVISETAAEVEKTESEPEAASAFKDGDSPTKVEETLHEDVEASKEATQPEVFVSKKVDPVTEVEDISEVAISEGEDLPTKVKESSEATNTIQPEYVSRKVDSITKIEASSETDTSEEGNSAEKVEESSKAVISEEKVETRPEVAVSEGEDLAIKVESCSDEAIQEAQVKIEPEAANPVEKDSATDEAASEEDTAVQKSTTRPEVAILEEVDSVTKLEIEHEGVISEERDSAAELKAVPEDDVVVEKSTAEPELTISEEAGLVMNVGGITKEAEQEKVDIEPEAAIYEEVDSTTTVGQSTQEADEVKKQDTEPEAVISTKKNSTAAFEAASENIEAHKSTTKPEVAIPKEVDPAIIVGGSTVEAYEVENQDTQPEADISKEEDSSTEFEAASEDVEGHKSTTEPELAISEEVNPVAKVGGSTSKADKVEKQETEPEVALRGKDSATEFEATSERDEEVRKSTIEAEVAISEELDSVKTVGGCEKEADEVEQQEIEPEATPSKENSFASEFESDSKEGVKAQSTAEPEAAISEEAIISQEKDSTAEFEAAKEEDAEVQKSTTEPEVDLSEEVYSVTKVGESTKEADKVEKQDLKPEVAMSIEKETVTECEAASEEDPELQKLTTITEVAIFEEVDSVTKVERSINEADQVDKSDTCGEKDSEAEASITKADESVKTEICEDTKVEVSLNEVDEVEKVAAEPEASVHEAEDSDAKVEMTNDNVDEEKEAAEPEASILEAEDSDAKVEMTNDDADEEKEAAEPAVVIQRDLVTEAEVSKETVEVEKETTKAEEAISEAVVSDRNIEDRSVDTAEDEKAPMELVRSVPEVESKACEINETQMDLIVESTEPGKKSYCGREIGASDQGDEMLSETTQRENENRNDALDHSSESTKKSLHESQDIQLDIQEKVEATIEEEAPKKDDSTEVATLSTEVHGDAEINGAKELHPVSVQEEKINNVNVSCLESTESVNATKSDGNEVQKIAESSLEEAQVSDKQAEVPNIPSDSHSQGTEIEESERNNTVETVESQVLSTDLASEASKAVADENVADVNPQDENADTVEESRKESETVAVFKHEELYTAETEVKIEAPVEETTGEEHGTLEKNELDETKESTRDSGEIGEKTKEVSKETLVSQDEGTVMEDDISVVETIPEEVKKEKCEARENAELAHKETPENVEVAESKTDADIMEEFQNQELCSAETGEADDVTKSIFKNQIEEAVIEKETIVLQENSKEETKEQQEVASPVLPSKEEASETIAAVGIEQNKREILSKADETPENSSEQKTTEEVNLQQEEPKLIEVSTLEPEIKSGQVHTKYEESERQEQSVAEMKDELEQSFVGVEPATEVLAASDQTLMEKASEAQNKPLPEELVLEEQEHGTWTVIEKKEQRIDETEVLKHITKETEESFFDKEESNKPDPKKATETQAGAVQIVNKDPESTYSDFRETGEKEDNQLSSVPRERKGQDEMAVISKEIQMDSPKENVEEIVKEVGLATDENLPEKTIVSDTILDCETETREETVTFGSESRSAGGLAESEAENDPKVLEAALTQSITEENLCMETFQEAESIPNEVNKEQIELEKGAKDYPSISHGEETTKDRHVEFKLKAEDSSVSEKEKSSEEVHAEEEEIDARKTIVDQIDNEKSTVEQPRQAVAEDVLQKIVEKETRELQPPLEEDKSGESSKEVPTGTAGVTNQEEYFNATPENQRATEAKPKKTAEVTTTDKCVETTEEIKAIAESTESAKISLFDMMQRSTREKQAITQEGETKDEVKAETEERTKSDEEKNGGEDDEEHKKNDSGSDDPVMLEASKDIDVKVPHKKSHNILSGVGSKVKHSISKVKKAITGKSSHSKQNSPKSGTKEQVKPGQ